jgi:hypothetical protein
MKYLKLKPESDLFLKLYKTLFVLIIISDFYLMYKSIGPVPPRNYFTLLTSVFVLGDFYFFGLKEFVRKYALSIGVLTLNIAFVIIWSLYGVHDYDYPIKSVLKFGTLFFSLQFLISKLSFNFIRKVLYVVCGVSFFVAMLQIFAPNIGWGIREFIDEETCKIFCQKESRPAGLAFYTLTLAQQLLLLSILLVHHAFKDKWMIFVNLIFFIGLVLINNRGGTVGYFIILGFTLFHKIPASAVKKGSALFVVSILGILALDFFEVRTLSFEGLNDTKRFDAFIASLILIRDNFFLGIGPAYNNSILGMFRDLVGQYDVFMEPEIVGKIYPHNYFLSSHLIYGLLGTIFNIYVFFKIYRKGLLFAAGILALSFNSFFHNSGYITSTATAIGVILLVSLDKRCLE